MIPDRTPQPIAYPGGFQRSIAGVWVALLLVGGLVLVPTACECGAGISHGHSLFTLRGHHHAPDGWYAYQDSAGPLDHQSHLVESATSSGPQLAGKVAHGSDRFSLALVTALTTSDVSQRISYPGASTTLGAGWSDAPGSPPPQQPLR